MVIPLLADQDLTPMLFEGGVLTFCSSRLIRRGEANSRIYVILKSFGKHEINLLNNTLHLLGFNSFLLNHIVD